MKEIRLLRPEDIEVRIQSCNEYGARLLLYKNARVDMNILDETFGMMNWKKSYQIIGDQLFCTIEVWDDEKKQWIGKQDVGVESNMEAEKGRASDAQKRAGFALGIGRELYSAPDMFVYARDLDQFKQSGQRYACYDKFIVKDIVYDGRKMAFVSIKNLNTNKIIEFGKLPSRSGYITQEQTTVLRNFLNSKGMEEIKALQSVGLSDFSKVTVDQYNQMIRLAGGK